MSEERPLFGSIWERQTVNSTRTQNKRLHIF